MPRTALTPVQLTKTYTGTPSANAIDSSFAASDNSNGNKFTAVEKNIIEFRNTDAGNQTFTIKGATGPYGPVPDYGPYTLGTTEEAAVECDLTGFIQTDGCIYIDTSSANVKVRVLRLP